MLNIHQVLSAAVSPAPPPTHTPSYLGVPRIQPSHRIWTNSNRRSNKHDRKQRNKQNISKAILFEADASQQEPTDNMEQFKKSSCRRRHSNKHITTRWLSLQLKCQLLPCYHTSTYFRAFLCKATPRESNYCLTFSGAPYDWSWCSRPLLFVANWKHLDSMDSGK